jgi:hypothetical protein
MNAPNGVNLMANTGLLGLTVPLVPVTLLFGPVVTFTIMLTGRLAATAWAWYHVLSRHIVGYWPAALVGELFAGFAPGMISQVNGHPDLVNQFLIPFIIWRAISLRTARRCGARAAGHLAGVPQRGTAVPDRTGRGGLRGGRVCSPPLDPSDPVTGDHDTRDSSWQSLTYCYHRKRARSVVFTFLNQVGNSTVFYRQMAGK